MASEQGRDGIGGHVHGDRWESVPTGYWLVSWGDGMSWHGMPFTDARCASKEVARKVVDEIAYWVTRSYWGDAPGARLVRHEVRPVEDGYVLVGWREFRAVSEQIVTNHVEVDGETYSRSRKEITYGPWRSADVRQVWQPDGGWGGKFEPAPDGHTDAVWIRCVPEVVTVLTACGVSDGE